LGRKFVLSNIIPTLLMSTLSSKFSTAANLFLIITWYCSLTPPLFKFLGFYLTVSIFHAAHLLTACLSLIFATTKHWSVSQSAPLKDRTSSTLECRLLSIKMWTIWSCVFPFPFQYVCAYIYTHTNTVYLSSSGVSKN
jgi:hypothetical protein